MKHMYGLCMDVECVGLCWMLNVLDLMYVWMLNECVCRCGHLLCEILYAHVFCHVFCVLCVMCMLSSLFFGEPRSSASIEHTPRVGTSAFSQLTPTPGAYWNPLPRSDEVPKLDVP